MNNGCGTALMERLGALSTDRPWLPGRRRLRCRQYRSQGVESMRRGRVRGARL